MELSEILKLVEKYPRDKFKVTAKREKNKIYITIKNRETKEERKLVIEGDKITESGEGYSIEQFDDNDGKFNIDENGNAIDDDDDAR